ncbi:carboxy terminal-processing peptidase [Psychrobacter sp. FDAARGOS_221]|uniref:carboxy terminal-processing peptidase n=1 Tax=Psychrobacter sp. FDAARGOS_221 TaxID=1975705 RepID=UPI000BB594DD|nr:carboxy terminal-processing peptidase [Psychrobacter sp. FDAARGOS_221]PNK60434.1 tail-specific protease [Psychrobacter sp. FDAARGOS_221]
MRFQPTQLVLSAAALGVAGIVFTHSYTAAVAADHTAFVASPEQQLTARQVSALLDRGHYSNIRFDESMGQKVLEMYFDRLDPNHTLFLQSDIDELTKKYGKTFAARLKKGDLSAAQDIFKRYTQRSNEYYNFANKFLTTKINLNRNDSVVLDREDAPRFKNNSQQRAYWERQLTLQVINLTLGQEEDKARDELYRKNPELTKGNDLILGEDRSPKEILLNRLKRQQEQLDRITSDEIMESVLNSATLTYDPHSNYYAPVQSVEMQVQSNLQLEGIGVSIRPYRKNPDYTQIVTLVDGGPAAKSGKVQPNDLILAVAKDGETLQDVVGWSTREVVALIRGKRGTDVTVKVKQPNSPDAAARTIVLTRDVIEQEDAGVSQRVVTVTPEGSNEQKRIGVLEIPSFYLNYQARRSGQDYRSVSIDTQNALKELNKQNIDGLVVDLRNNPGGSLDEVAKMLGLFIKEGPLVQIRDNRGNVQVYQDEDGGKQLYSGDMVVIVNKASASASEIFAAAVQDYGRGLVVGSTTTGKGSAQVQLDSLALGSATLTQRKFYRITGGSTQNKGVVPDVELVNIYEGAEFSERDQKNAMAWDTIKTSPYKPEGRFSSNTLATLNQQSKIRQTTNPQFVYLDTLNKVRNMEDDKKPVKLNISERRAHQKQVELRTLDAENARRKALGEKPYATWTEYQAAVEALFEERSRMKTDERPKLPENEAFVIEAAKIMLQAKDKK